ncbi:MAG TPA: 50S ribosomal protein L15 [Syntrophales bacterium]|nr:50S ribosomal protein L15 [Syntrophales bacterium]HPX55777.1 50S ribosomal protein L15 [Syntrophales bacterium]HQA83099.1 50S ribosomal protein L15 [Syntrophales bacterium]
MNLGTLRPPDGSRRNRKRVGRGDGSGHGGTAGKGHKGQKARSGGKVRPGFEGGQMPLARRLPKRGFRNLFRKEVVAVNVANLNRFAENTVVDAELLLKSGLIKRTGDAIKILGKGDINVPLTIKVDLISKGAKTKIEAAGGSFVEVE